ncbi:MAG TPA: TatD family hydrolase [Pseudobdellovibrionaceae bacterium]|nr:TatD family hydrolase [Pseudobdellovibrionaceae bacterium]
MWIDMHVHLDKLGSTPIEILKRATEAGVERMITIGTEASDLPVVLKLAEEFAPRVFCTLGIHPHEGTTYNSEVEKFIVQNISHPRCVAVGEIGLDYYYEHASREEQISAFRAQLEIARKFQMPVEIHTRDAEKDTIDILQEYKGQVRGLIHCFTGTQWLAERALELGFDISISGVVTFKNAQSLRDTVKGIPLNRIHVETDAPYLSPVPLRGKENEPSYVVHTAKVVADLHGVSIETLAQQTRQNAENLFPKLRV